MRTSTSPLLLASLSIRMLLAGTTVLASGCSSGTSSPQPAGDAAPAPPAPTPRWRAAVGAAGAFTQTFDEHVWATRSLTAQDLYAVTCVGNFNGWVAGEAGMVAHTTDSGQTWARQDAHTVASLRAIRFGTPALGLVAGDAGTLALTLDGGSTWITVAPLTTGALHGVAIAADAGVLIAVGDRGVVLRSLDGGNSWAASAIPTADDLRGVAIDPGAHQVLAVDASGAIWSSADAGFLFAREASAGAPLDAIAMTDDGTTALAAGAHGTVFERASGGVWRAEYSGTSSDLHAALITGDADSRHYVAGASGTLLASSNRGATWSSIATSTKSSLYGIDDL